jgi:hypothetical protein
MKKIFYIIGLFISLSSFYLAGSADVETALKNGNAAEFSSYFDKFVDIKLPDKDEVKNVGKTQASVAIKSFFDANNIKGFEKISEREMGGTMYIAGKLKGASKNYNITLMIKITGDKQSVITIRIS